jgi:hypothetical protein
LLEKLKPLAKVNKILLLLEGSSYDEEPDEIGAYGIEDKHDLVSNYAKILLAHRKTCSFLQCQGRIEWDLIAYYTTSVFQLFIEADANRPGPLYEAMKNTINDIFINEIEANKILSTFLAKIFTEENKEYFYADFYDPNREDYPKECLYYFEEHKASFDIILRVMAVHLSRAIREEFSTVNEITNHEGLSEEKIESFFEAPRDGIFAEDVVAKNLRNIIFAKNILEITNKTNNTGTLCVVVGNKHVEGLNDILARDSNLEISTYNAEKNELPKY